MRGFQVRRGLKLGLRMLLEIRVLKNQTKCTSAQSINKNSKTNNKSNGAGEEEEEEDAEYGQEIDEEEELQGIWEEELRGFEGEEDEEEGDEGDYGYGGKPFLLPFTSKV